MLVLVHLQCRHQVYRVRDLDEDPFDVPFEGANDEIEVPARSPRHDIEETDRRGEQMVQLAWRGRLGRPLLTLLRRQRARPGGCRDRACRVA